MQWREVILAFFLVFWLFRFFLFGALCCTFHLFLLALIPSNTSLNLRIVCPPPRLPLPPSNDFTFVLGGMALDAQSLEIPGFVGPTEAVRGCSLMHDVVAVIALYQAR